MNKLPIGFVFVFFLLAFSISDVTAYTNGMAASVVIGQSSFTSFSAFGGTSIGANNFSNYVGGVTVAGNKFIASDYNDSRILIWNSIPTSNFTNADIVVGQTNFTGSGAPYPPSATSLNQPVHISSDGTRLFVADYNNYRVLIYNTIPTTNGAAADIVVGQLNMSNQDTVASSIVLGRPTDVYYDPQSGKLVITDQDNNRILIYNHVPTSNGTTADVVVGQTNFTNGGSGTSASTLSSPTSARIVNGKLIIADKSNSRVLIWNQVPTANGASADVVIGQSDLVSSNTGTTASSFYWPTDLSWDGKHLAVVDSINSRVLLFNGIPTSNNASASVVIGQSSFTSSINGASAILLKSPADGIIFSDNKLIVSDSGARRVLIFNDVVNNPSVTVSGFSNSPTGRTRISGHVSLPTGSNYTLTSIDASVNGGGLQSVTPTDGAFNSKDEDWYFDFDKGNYLNNFDSRNFTIRIFAYNSNLDVTDNFFYFTPFDLISPDDKNIWNTSIQGNFPAFTFRVASYPNSRVVLRNSLSRYKIQVRKSGSTSGTDWITYLDNIPIDPSEQTVAATSFDNPNFTAMYSQDRSLISVYAKSTSQTLRSIYDGGNLLPNGDYEWKVQAVDKSGHTTDTGTRTLKIKGSNLVFPGSVFGSSSILSGGFYFPISIIYLTGTKIGEISTNNTNSIKDIYSTSSTNPIFYGIAPAGSYMSLTLTDLDPKCKTNCVLTFNTTANIISRYGINTKSLQRKHTYRVDLTGLSGTYFNRLPSFNLKVF